MKAKLTKTFFDGWTNYRLKNKDGVTIATTKYPFSDEQVLLAKGKEVVLNKLSIKNCEAIKNGYDLDELAKKSSESQSLFNDLACYETGFIRGAKTILEILGDKKFSEEDVRKAYHVGKVSKGNHVAGLGKQASDVLVESLQQTEWNVEIEMDATPLLFMGRNAGRNLGILPDLSPKLDSNNYLILKRI
jgi:hypothetical protein